MSDLRISTVLAEIDGTCDYIPVVSTVTNVVDIFNKCVYQCLPEDIAKNRYWTHINDKELSRCFILLVPVLGNIYIIVSDYFKYGEDQTQCEREIQNYRDTLRSSAHELASLARRETRLEVTTDQMMTAPTEGEQRLWAACFSKDTRQLRELLNTGISPNFYNSGTTPLVIACLYGTVDTVCLLVEKGADANLVDRLGNSPLGVACMNGNKEMVEFLAKRVGDINAANPKGVTPLMHAAAGGHREVVDVLLRHGANSRKQALDSTDAVTNAILFHDDVEMLFALLGKDEKVDDRRYHFTVPGVNQFPLVATLTTQNLTPLSYAAIVGGDKSAVSLVSRSNVKHLDSTNSNALYYASKNMKLLQALLNKCKDPDFVNQQNTRGATALHHALEFERADAAFLLLQNGADPLLVDNEGRTPLILACWKNYTNIVEYIQQHHAAKITPEIQAQVAAIAARVRKAQMSRQQIERVNVLSKAVELMQVGITNLQADSERRTAVTQEIEDLGPIPRNSMELFLGQLPWPVVHNFRQRV